jgi:hypothetical protein
MRGGKKDGGYAQVRGDDGRNCVGSPYECVDGACFGCWVGFINCLFGDFGCFGLGGGSYSGSGRYKGVEIDNQVV